MIVFGSKSACYLPALSVLTGIAGSIASGLPPTLRQESTAGWQDFEPSLINSPSRPSTPYGPRTEGHEATFPLMSSFNVEFDRGLREAYGERAGNGDPNIHILPPAISAGTSRDKNPASSTIDRSMHPVDVPEYATLQYKLPEWTQFLLKGRRTALHNKQYIQSMEALARALTSPPDEVHLSKENDGSNRLIPHRHGLTNRQYLHQKSVLKLLPKSVHKHLPEPTPSDKAKVGASSDKTPSLVDPTYDVYLLDPIQRARLSPPDDVMVFRRPDGTWVPHPQGWTNRQYCADFRKKHAARARKRREKYRYKAGDILEIGAGNPPESSVFQQ